MNARRLGLLAVVLALVLAPGVGAIALSTQATAQQQSPPGFVDVPDTSVDTTDETVDPRGPPSGVLSQSPGKPAWQSLRDLPESATTGIKVDAHPSSTTVQWAKNRRGGIALVLTDDANHGARRIAIPTTALEAAAGKRPQVAFGVHEDGSEWSSAISYQNGYAVFEIPRFSTNTVTWSGQYTYEGNPSIDKATFTYDQPSETSATNFVINVTGNTSTESDTETGSGLEDGATASISVSGTQAPTNTNLTITAREQRVTQHESNDQSHSLWGSNTGTAAHIWSENEIDNPPKNITAINVKSANVDDRYGGYVEVYIVEEETDGDPDDGTLVGNFSNPGAGRMDITDYTVSDTSGPVTVQFVSTGPTGDNNWFTVDLDSSASSVYFNGNNGLGSSNVEAHSPIELVSDPAPDLNVSADDGTFNDFGSFTDGQSKSSAFGVSTSATSLDFGNFSGEIDWNLTYTERTQTVDPSIQVNGNWTNHTGTLTDGSTQSLTTNSDWVVGGSNTVNITVGDGSLTADAPTPQVDLYYTHNGDDKSEVDYDGEKWSERYNVSKTYATDHADANLTIPFQSTVVSIRDLEKQTNGGSWSTISSSNYSLDGTTLTAELGSVSANDKVRVRTTASKVNPNNATITVTSPTPVGGDMASEIQLDTWASDSYIGVGGTVDGAEIHYTTGESWSSPDTYARFKTVGVQRLYMPGASDGSTLTVKTMRVTVSPKVGDVDIRPEQTGTSEPAFKVEEGPSPEDAIQYTFLDAVGGTSYILYSTTEQIVRASGTASSPLTLDDDDSAEILQFQVDDGTSGGGSGGGGGGGGASGGGIIRSTEPDLLTDNPILAFGLLGIVALLVVGLVVASDRTAGRGASAATSRLRGLPAGAVLERIADAVLSILRLVVREPLAMGAVALFIVGVFFRLGLLPSIPSEYIIAVPLVFAPIASYLLLREIGAFNLYVWLGGTLMAAFAMAETLRPGSIVGPLGEGIGEFTGLAILVVGALIFQWLRSRDTDIIIEGREQ